MVLDDRRRSRAWPELAALLALLAAAIAFIHPRGEFPTADDWDFTIATWNFARSGHFHFTPFTAVSLRAMVMWGAAWTRLFGESFEVLRASTLALGAGFIIVIHRILWRAGLPRFGRIVATLALAFHPIFLWASCTYMTEVPFVFASAVAFLLIWRGLAEERPALVAAGCVAAMVACFVRQTGIINIVAPLVVVLIFRQRSAGRWRLFAAFLGATAGLFGLLLLFKREWLAGSPAEFAEHYKMWHESSFRLPEMIATADHYAVFNAQNAGLFFLPLVLPLILLFRREGGRAVVAFAAVAAVVLWRVQELVNAGITMPYFTFAPLEDLLPGNVFMDFGLGAPSMTDVWFMGKPYPFHLTHAARLILTYGSVAAAALLVSSLMIALPRAMREPRANLLLILSCALAVTGTAALFVSGLYNDRYSLDSAWSIGIALALIVPWEKRTARTLAATALITVAVFSILSVQEYFAWNRARWSAYRGLLAQGVAVTQIDGGNEPSSWYEMSKMTRREARKFIVMHGRRPYLLAFRPLPGYSEVGRVPFQGWFGLHRGAIYILRFTGTSG